MRRLFLGCLLSITPVVGFAVPSPDTDFNNLSKAFEMRAPNPNANCGTELNKAINKKKSRQVIKRYQPGIEASRIDFALTSQALWFDVRAYDKDWFYKMWGKTDLISKYRNLWTQHCKEHNGTFRESTQYALGQMTATHQVGVSWQTSEMPNDISTVMATAVSVKKGITAGVNAGIMCGQNTVFVTAFTENPYKRPNGTLEIKFDSGSWKQFDVVIEQPGIIIILDVGKSKDLIQSMKRGSTMMVRPYSGLLESEHVATYDLKGFTKAVSMSKYCN